MRTKRSTKNKDKSNRPKDIEDFVRESKNLATADETGMADDYEVANHPEQTVICNFDMSSKKVGKMSKKEFGKKSKKDVDKASQLSALPAPPPIRRVKREMTHALPSDLCEQFIYYIVGAVCTVSFAFTLVVTLETARAIDL